ncbi:N-alpha-acetyltransferase 25, NatB auxiliary subunit [Cimex lectularius]|uniref:N-terminal acetyltransferase B complex subunit MDM20 homolog n=1 Tax=Cimex lectularius TaxID=79782 RepID=A0A8I6S060_CIMLE|nr:N-alpha-acetyltransferase 25, NatB auxiliary subunit [Cimex lectularius]
MISGVCCPVTERRLRPIYDSLDNGNNKKALQEAEKVLKKQPNLQCAKVLKCLALLRMGKKTECTELLEVIKNESPVEESTLQLMTVCYWDINKPDLICQLYENASKKDPSNEDILNNLFLSYVRIGDYKKQQLSALALYKVIPKSQYFFWAIISILLQAVDRVSDLISVFSEPVYSPHLCAKDRPYVYNYLSDKKIEDQKKLVNVKVAERMLEKYLDKEKLNSEHELLVYMAVLDLLDKHEQALAVLESQELSSLLDESTILNLKLSFLAKQRKWTAINILVKQYLEEGLDGWNYFLYYIDSVYELSKESQDDSEFLKAQQFIETLAKESTGWKKRAPYIARLELCSRFSKFTNVLNYLVEYFKEYGTKEVCVHDLKPYLHLLSNDNCNEFLRLIWEPTKSVDSTKSRMEFHICHEEFARVMACKMCDRRLYVSQLVQCFIDALQFNTNIPSTETRSSDRYALLALFTLYDLWLDTSVSDYLIEGVTLCHYALLKSPSNSQFKLLLLKFSHLLGCSESAQLAYVFLDIKQMQLDTLGYLHVFPLIYHASYTNATAILLSTLKFFNTNRKESADHIAHAYKYDAYTKIPEIISIKEKLNNSIHFYMAQVERMLLLIFLSETYVSTLLIIRDFAVDPEVDKIPWMYLEDNRDLNVLWDLEPKDRSLTQEEIDVSHNLDLTYLSLRSRLLRMIITSIHLGSANVESMKDFEGSDDNGSTSSFISLKNILINLIKQMEQDLEKLKNNPPKLCLKKPSIASPPKSRLPLIHSQNYFDIVLNAMWFLLSLIPGTVPGKDVGEEACKYRLGVIMVLSEQFALSFSIRSLEVEKRLEMIEICSLFVEIASVSCIIVGVCDVILSKMKNILTKKSKKKKDGMQKVDLPSELEWRTNMLNKFIVYASDTIKSMDCVLKSEEKMLKSEISKYGVFQLYDLIKEKKDESYEINHKEWSDLENMSKTINEKVINSHTTSVNNMSNVLRSKLKYLSSLKI